MNSSEQFLKIKSTNLEGISASSDYGRKKVKNQDFINYDNNNLFRTSYNDMSVTVRN